MVRSADYSTYNPNSDRRFSILTLCFSSNDQTPQGSLWYPETSAEIFFVKTAFASTNNLYHLGIRSNHENSGMVFSDYSVGLGIPFYTRKQLDYCNL